MLIKRRKNLFILWEVTGSSFGQTWIPFTQGCLCQIWLKLAQRFWRWRFSNFFNVFSLFRNYPPWKRVEPFIWTNFNPHHPRMLVPSLVEIGPLVLEKKFFTFINVLCLNPLGNRNRVEPFIWTNLNSFHPSSLVEMGSVVLEKNIFEFHQCVFSIL